MTATPSLIEMARQAHADGRITDEDMLFCEELDALTEELITIGQRERQAQRTRIEQLLNDPSYRRPALSELDAGLRTR